MPTPITNPQSELPLHGERGILTYDEIDDRIQFHFCGGWYQKLESHHLRMYELTVPS